MKRNKIFEEAVYGEYEGWSTLPYDDDEVLLYGITIKEYKDVFLSKDSTQEDRNRVEDNIRQALFWKRKKEYDDAKEKETPYSEKEIKTMMNMGWGDKSDYLRENGYHLIIEEINGGGVGNEDSPKWIASIDGEWRTYGNSIPEVINKIFDSIISSDINA